MKRVLVTRPEPGATATAGRLREMGFEPLLLPLTRIVGREVDANPAGSSDAVIVTSANALRHAPAKLIADLLHVPLFAVGERTAEQARDKGFQAVEAGAGEARTLAEAVLASLPAGSRVLYLAGTERDGWLERHLGQADYEVDVVEIYDAPEVSYTTDFLLRMLGGGAVDVALIHSPRAGRLLAPIAGRAELAQCFEKTVFAAISERAAATVTAVAPGRILVADAPTEEALLRLAMRC